MTSTGEKSMEGHCSLIEEISRYRSLQRSSALVSHLAMLWLSSILLTCSDECILALLTKMELQSGLYFSSLRINISYAR